MRFFLNLLHSANNFFYFTYNYISIKRCKVVYKKFPVIYGRLLIKNNGYCEFGDNVTFKSKPSSNYAGLTKKSSVFIMPGAKLIIGHNTGFSAVSVYCSTSVTIGNFVTCGANVSIWDTDFHPLGFEDRRVHNTAKILCAPVKIGDDVFLGANSIVLKGVTVGKRSIIGAGSVVAKSIPDDEIWAGNPARFIKKNSNTLLL